MVECCCEEEEAIVERCCCCGGAMATVKRFRGATWDDNALLLSEEIGGRDVVGRWNHMAVLFELYNNFEFVRFLCRLCISRGLVLSTKNNAINQCFQNLVSSGSLAHQNGLFLPFHCVRFGCAV